MSDGEHLTPEELAGRERVPLATIYQWNSRGNGPPFMKIGRYVRYRLVDVVEWEKSRCVDVAPIAREPA